MSGMTIKPQEVQALIDSHGREIPHLAFSGPYTIDVYPGWPYATDNGLGPCHKVVHIWNRETGEFWSEVIP